MKVIKTIEKLMAITIVGAALALVGCEKTAEGVKEDTTEAVEATKEAAKEAGDATKGAAKKAGDAAKKTVNKAAKKVEKATEQ
jgi:hypothetical protein